jgi:hypothetical protein
VPVPPNSIERTILAGKAVSARRLREVTGPFEHQASLPAQLKYDPLTPPPYPYPYPYPSPIPGAPRNDRAAIVETDGVGASGGA